MLFAQSALAAKKNTTKKAQSSLGGVVVSIRVRQDKHAVIVIFSNLKNIKTISYVLSYQTDGNYEGAVGRITVRNPKAIKRELLFGTCSAGVCRYHENITNASLEVTVTFKNGKKSTRSYPIKL